MEAGAYVRSTRRLIAARRPQQLRGADEDEVANSAREHVDADGAVAAMMALRRRVAIERACREPSQHRAQPENESGEAML